MGEFFTWTGHHPACLSGGSWSRPRKPLGITNPRRSPHLATTDSVPRQIFGEGKEPIVQLTIHRGTHEIGGSCIEIATDTTRIILDVGLPLVDADREPFDPTSIRGKSVEDLIAVAPCPGCPACSPRGRRRLAILLSHSHPDHTGLLHLTDSGIPVYASSGTSKMMLASAVFSWQHDWTGAATVKSHRAGRST